MKAVMKKDGTYSGRIKKTTIAVMTVLSIVVLCASCAADLSSTAITFVRGTVIVADEPISAPFELSSNETMRCEENALAVMQVSNAVKLVLRSGAVLTYTVSKSEGIINIVLEKGSVAGQIVKRGVAVHVTAGDVFISSKKGAFDITRDGDALALSVFDGAISVSHHNTTKELAAGDRFEKLVDAQTVRKLTPQERRLFALLQKVHFVDASRLTGEVSPSSVVPVPVLIEIVTLTPVKLSEVMGMATLAQKVGQLSVVTTKKGRTITGHLRARGKLVDIATREGIVTIPQKDIASVSPYAAVR
jgi:hypothetical protein